MALYNFQKRFAPKILSGEKRHTIRADRKDGRVPKPGELCHLYTGLRQKDPQLLMRVRCIRVESIEIRGGLTVPFSVQPLFISIEGVLLSLDESEQLAISDGFSSLLEMVEFWRGRTPFAGNIIYWKFSPEQQSNQEIETCANASAPDARKSSAATIATAPRNAEKPSKTMTGASCAKPSKTAANAAQPVDTAPSTTR